MIVPFVPGDSIFEAYRLATRAKIHVALIDPDVSTDGEVRPKTQMVSPEPAADPVVGFFAAADALNERDAILPSDLAREAGMARALLALMEQHETVLWVGGLAHWSRIVERLQSRDFTAPRLPGARARRFEHARLESSALLRLTGTSPSALAHFVREPLRFEPFDAMRSLLHEAAPPTAPADGQPPESTTPIDLARTGLYARNLAATARLGYEPQLSELILAANATIGPQFAARVFSVATKQISGKKIRAVDPLTFEVRGTTTRRDHLQAGFWFRGKRLSAEPWSAPPWPVLAPPDVEQLTRAALDAEYDNLPDAEGEEEFHWEAYPPDEAEYEAFVEYALRHASEVHPGDVRSAPFASGLQDGVDVRGTIRFWHDDQVYVREQQRAPAHFRNGVIDWSCDAESSRFLQGKPGGWNDPDSKRIGSVSRELRPHTVIYEKGEAQVTLRERGWSMITLDRPTEMAPPHGKKSFFNVVIRPLLSLPGGRSDTIYAWLEVMFRFCAGKPFVYYSRYRPGPRIWTLAHKHHVKLTWRPLASLSSPSVERHRTFRQLWLAKSQWKRLHARLATARGGVDRSAAHRPTHIPGPTRSSDKSRART